MDAPRGYRNGYGKPRKLTTSSETVTIRRPGVRDLDEQFEIRALPLFSRRTKEVGRLIPELYLHGLAEKQFRKLHAPYRLKDVFEGRTFEDGKPASDHQRKETA